MVTNLEVLEGGSSLIFRVAFMLEGNVARRMVIFMDLLVQHLMPAL